jgi:hypothetical protein
MNVEGTAHVTSRNYRRFNMLMMHVAGLELELAPRPRAFSTIQGVLVVVSTCCPGTGPTFD